MKPQFIRIKEQQVAFYESNKKGPPLVFIHGNSMSANAFKHQFASELFSKYRIISVDLPGHGLSEFARDPEEMYTLPGYSDFLSDFLNELHIEKATLVGHSMGGHIILHYLEKCVDKVKGLVIFGTPPIKIPINMELAYHPNPIFALAFKDQLNKEEIVELASNYTTSNSTIINEIAHQIIITDPRMRVIMGKSTGLGKFVHELEILNETKIPIAILHGEHDSMINPKYFESINIPMLWKGKVHIIKDSGHCPQLEKPIEFNKLISSFLDDF